MGEAKGEGRRAALKVEGGSLPAPGKGWFWYAVILEKII